MTTAETPAQQSAADDLPAWAEPFAPGSLAGLARRRHLTDIDRDWAFGDSTGRGMTVAIIDSGLEADHPALLGRVVESVAVTIDGDGEPNVVADDGVDLYGHGTACGGIILGFAPEVELVSIRVLGANLRGSGAAFIAAIDWAIERGIEVVNLSLSSRKAELFPVFHEVVDEAYFKGMKLVGAANNAQVLSYPPSSHRSSRWPPTASPNPGAGTTTRARRSSSAPGEWTCPSPGRTAARRSRRATASPRRTSRASWHDSARSIPA